MVNLHLDEQFILFKDNDRSEQVIGKLLYSGESSKDSLTDGKIYECIGLSFGKIRIIDDSGEAFYFSARHLSHKDKNAGWIVIEDKSPKQLMSAFINGFQMLFLTHKSLEP